MVTPDAQVNLDVLLDMLLVPVTTYADLVGRLEVHDPSDLRVGNEKITMRYLIVRPLRPVSDIGHWHTHPTVMVAEGLWRIGGPPKEEGEKAGDQKIWLPEDNTSIPDAEILDRRSIGGAKEALVSLRPKDVMISRSEPAGQKVRKFFGACGNFLLTWQFNYYGDQIGWEDDFRVVPTSAFMADGEVYFIGNEQGKLTDNYGLYKRNEKGELVPLCKNHTTYRGC